MRTRCLVLTLLAVSLHGETSQEKGQQLIRQCLEAVGGQAFVRMRDRVQTGRAYQFYQERLGGFAVVTYYIKYDPKPSSPEPGWIGIRERRDIGKDKAYGAIFADGKGYEVTFRGARPFPESYMQQYR